MRWRSRGAPPSAWAGGRRCTIASGPRRWRAPEATFDLAGARRERYERPGALPDVELGASLRDDLARRDFTVNAIALHLADGGLVSGPAAVEDLAPAACGCCTTRSFRDDPTRLLRLARYAARLGFEPEPRTDGLAAEAVADGALETVTGPRLGAELRLLLGEPQPAALAALERHGLGRRRAGAALPRRCRRLSSARSALAARRARRPRGARDDADRSDDARASDASTASASRRASAGSSPRPRPGAVLADAMAMR